MLSPVDNLVRLPGVLCETRLPNLEPRPLGRPPHETSAEAQRIVELETRLAEVEHARQTAEVRLTLYRTFTGMMWGPMSGAVLLTVVPVLILAIAIQKYLVRGLTLGAVKG